MAGLWDDLPRYFIVGLRPVKVVPRRDGSIRIFAYDVDSRDFVLDPTYMSRIFFAADGVRELGEDEFEARVAELQRSPGG